MPALIGLNTVLYESTKHRTNESSRHHPQKWQINFRIFPWVLLNSLFSNCHIENVQVFMGNNSAGFH